MKKLIVFLLLFIFLTSCRSVTYVKYDRNGKGDVKTRRGINYPYTDPYFRYDDLPAKQKKGRIKRSKKKVS